MRTERASQQEVSELLSKNLPLFAIEIEDYGYEECVFQGITRESAELEFRKWLSSEPHVMEWKGE